MHRIFLLLWLKLCDSDQVDMSFCSSAVDLGLISVHNYLADGNGKFIKA